MMVKWYHFVLLVTLANANPIGNPAEEQFLKKYFNSGFEFKSDEEKSFRTVSNYAKVRLKFSSIFKVKCDKIHNSISIQCSKMSIFFISLKLLQLNFFFNQNYNIDNI